jgi:hypothetical protein
VTEPALTEAMIATAMAKADARVCVGADRCFVFPDRLEDARKTCTPKGAARWGAPEGSSSVGAGARAGTCGSRWGHASRVGKGATRQAGGLLHRT